MQKATCYKSTMSERMNIFEAAKERLTILSQHQCREPLNVHRRSIVGQSIKGGPVQGRI
jgi:hypothetical protein